jgi:hypothetical protein
VIKNPNTDRHATAKALVDTAPTRRCGFSQILKATTEIKEAGGQPLEVLKKLFSPQKLAQMRNRLPPDLYARRTNSPQKRQNYKTSKHSPQKRKRRLQTKLETAEIMTKTAASNNDNTTTTTNSATHASATRRRSNHAQRGGHANRRNSPTSREGTHRRCPSSSESGGGPRLGAHLQTQGPARRSG